MEYWVRPSVERTRGLVVSFNLGPGGSDADIAAGVGYLLPYLVARVGQEGAILAQDICPDSLANTEETIKSAGWGNVCTL